MFKVVPITDRPVNNQTIVSYQMSTLHLYYFIIYTSLDLSLDHNQHTEGIAWKTQISYLSYIKNKKAGIVHPVP